MSFGRYEVLTGDLRRRHWPRSLKEEVVLETLAAGSTVTQVARRRGIDRGLIYRWRRQMMVRTAQAQAFLPVQVSEAMLPAVFDPKDGHVAEERSDSASPQDAGCPTGRMEISLGGGRRIVVFADVDPTALARVIGVLGGR